MEEYIFLKSSMKNSTCTQILSTEMHVIGRCTNRQKKRPKWFILLIEKLQYMASLVLLWPQTCHLQRLCQEPQYKVEISSSQQHSLGLCPSPAPLVVPAGDWVGTLGWIGAQMKLLESSSPLSLCLVECVSRVQHDGGSISGSSQLVPTCLVCPHHCSGGPLMFGSCHWWPQKMFQILREGV